MYVCIAVVVVVVVVVAVAVAVAIVVAIVVAVVGQADRYTSAPASVRLDHVYPGCAGAGAVRTEYFNKRERQGQEKRRGYQGTEPCGQGLEYSVHETKKHISLTSI